MRFPSKLSVSQREAKILAEWGISLRPGIERDTLLMPWLIADSVIHEASCFLDVQLPVEWSDWLDQRAERCYARNQQFRQFVRRKENSGRNCLYRFFRHWLAGKLQKERLSLFQRLPRTYLLGAPLKF